RTFLSNSQNRNNSARWNCAEHSRAEFHRAPEETLSGIPQIQPETRAHLCHEDRLYRALAFANPQRLRRALQQFSFCFRQCSSSVTDLSSCRTKRLCRTIYNVG